MPFTIIHRNLEKAKTNKYLCIVAVLFTLFYLPRNNPPESFSNTVQSETEDTLDQGYDGMIDYSD